MNGADLNWSPNQSAACKIKFFTLDQVSAENLTGLNPTVAARVVYDGGVFIGPIFGDMLATCNNSTQVSQWLTMLPVDACGKSFKGIWVLGSC